MNKSSKYLFLLLLFLIYSWVSLFTTIQERQKFLEQLTYAIQSNPFIPKITVTPIMKQEECNKEIDNPEYSKYVQEATDKCINEKSPTSRSNVTKTGVDLTKIDETNCKYKILSDLSAPKSKIQIKTPCNTIIGYNKWVTFLDIRWLKIGNMLLKN